MKSKALKDLATIVASVSGIIVGIDKVKTITTKWRGEYKQKQYEKKAKETRLDNKESTERKCSNCKCNTELNK